MDLARAVRKAQITVDRIKAVPITIPHIKVCFALCSHSSQTSHVFLGVFFLFMLQIGGNQGPSDQGGTRLYHSKMKFD